MNRQTFYLSMIGQKKKLKDHYRSKMSIILLLILTVKQTYHSSSELGACNN